MVVDDADAEADDAAQDVDDVADVMIPAEFAKLLLLRNVATDAAIDFLFVGCGCRYDTEWTVRWKAKQQQLKDLLLADLLPALKRNNIVEKQIVEIDIILPCMT